MTAHVHTPARSRVRLLLAETALRAISIALYRHAQAVGTAAAACLGAAAEQMPMVTAPAGAGGPPQDDAFVAWAEELWQRKK